MSTTTLTRPKSLVHTHKPGPPCAAREIDGHLYGDCVLGPLEVTVSSNREGAQEQVHEITAPETTPSTRRSPATSAGSLSKPKARTERKRKAGGDDSVERDGMGRPRILIKCDVCSGEPEPGRVPGARAGKTKQCPRCNTGDAKKDSPPGWRKVSYTRTTTYIDVLEDKEQLMVYEGRMVLIGAALDTGFLKDVAQMDPEADKDTLNHRAKAAKELAGANKKSNDGTFLHELSEIIDRNEVLPKTHPDPETGEDREVTLSDLERMMSYREATTVLSIVLMEQLMVNDDLQVAGTPDRVSRLDVDVAARVVAGEVKCPLEIIEVDGAFFLVAPDGTLIGDSELIITDLKTGRIDYGALKMAMQLALYSRSKKYDKANGKRIIVPRINQKWGLVMHMPSQGESQGTTLCWVNLELGWEAVLLARQVRAIRSRGRKALIRLETVATNE